MAEKNLQGIAKLGSIISEKPIRPDEPPFHRECVRGGFMISSVIPLEREDLPETDGFDQIYEQYFEMIYKICYVYFHSVKADCEDAVQTVFMKYLECSNRPNTGEHTKAWLILTAKNTCKSMLKLKHRSHHELEAASGISVGFEYNEALHEIMKLPEKERIAVYLCLYERYSAAEAAKVIGCRKNTVYSHLHRARKKLMKALGE